jgi:hypothetical protein
VSRLGEMASYPPRLYARVQRRDGHEALFEVRCGIAGAPPSPAKVRATRQVENQKMA